MDGGEDGGVVRRRRPRRAHLILRGSERSSCGIRSVAGIGRGRACAQEEGTRDQGGGERAHGTSPRNGPDPGVAGDGSRPSRSRRPLDGGSEPLPRNGGRDPSAGAASRAGTGRPRQARTAIGRSIAFPHSAQEPS